MDRVKERVFKDWFWEFLEFIKTSILENQTDTDDGSKDQNAVMSTVPSVRDHLGRGWTEMMAGDATCRGCPCRGCPCPGRHIPGLWLPHAGVATFWVATCRPRPSPAGPSRCLWTMKFASSKASYIIQNLHTIFSKLYPFTLVHSYQAM
jgi:hypothetical protein